MVGYLQISKNELEERAQKAWEFLNPCRVCPRECRVDRQQVEPQPTGFCQMGKKVYISGAHPHFGEESVLVGSGGSGTIFFTSCNLGCIYCQNWQISQARRGRKITIKQLAQIMINLQDKGCHNINFVTPTIWIPQILKALILAIDKGLKLPLVYNTGGYDSVEMLKLLDGIIDIYMPDVKYANDRIGKKYSLVSDYWSVVQKAVEKMHEQSGDLIIKDGLAVKGLLIRHLVLPNNLAGTKKVMEFLASLSKDTYVNIMAQYRPAHKANQYPKLDRRIRPEEYEQAIKKAQKSGLHRFDKR